MRNTRQEQKEEVGNGKKGRKKEKRRKEEVRSSTLSFCAVG